jgi:hypothetical protein
MRTVALTRIWLSVLITSSVVLAQQPTSSRTSGRAKPQPTTAITPASPTDTAQQSTTQTPADQTPQTPKDEMWHIAEPGIKQFSHGSAGVET